MSERREVGVTMNIRTTYDPKPIPDRRYDWTATEIDYEPGRPIGYGVTEAEAINDLQDQMEDECSG